MRKHSIRTLLLGSLTLGAAALSACTNPEVPAGHEGYIYHTPMVFGKMEYRESLPGPATTGVSWRLFAINIDMRTRSYKEDFNLLTAENLSVTFEVNTRIKLRAGSVRDIVENWGAEHWYEWNVKERLRTIVREQVTEFSALAIQLETPKVRAQIEDKLKEQFSTDPATGKSTPIVIESVDIGEIHFPKEVADAIERKIATKQELERQRFVLAKTKKEAAIKVLEAIRVAKQQLIISSTLDPLYVQQRAIQVYRRVAKSDNETTIVLPNSGEGTALPLVLEPKSRRVLSTVDKERINQELTALEEEFKASAAAPENNSQSETIKGEATPGDAQDGEQSAEPIEGEAPEGAAPASPSGEPADQGAAPNTTGSLPPVVPSGKRAARSSMQQKNCGFFSRGRFIRSNDSNCNSKGGKAHQASGPKAGIRPTSFKASAQ